MTTECFLKVLKIALSFTEYVTARMRTNSGVTLLLDSAKSSSRSGNNWSLPGGLGVFGISSGFPSARFLAHVEGNLENFEPLELREQVALSWAREKEVETEEEVADLLHNQMPFHFANPLDTRIQEFEERTK